ncbi:M20/M25/M40 family metallo-hydrolase [Streptomyces sp. NPDC048717]|uniref:M20/M25/M40 family metallo-hydrolase n=1 Tax=Streptomyces sp. NPDC048717 TaxID=3154928 RepID=UPI0034216838
MSGSWLRIRDEEKNGGPADTLAVCFAPTGAHGSTFAGWHGRLPHGMALVLVTPPGRGTRVDEEPVVDMAVYADAVVAEVRALAAGRRLVLIGVSLGALLAFEVCRRLLETGVPVARLCVVAGQSPGDFAGAGGEVTLEDARAFATGTGLTDPELLADPEFEEVLLPPIQADLTLAAHYAGRASAAAHVSLRAVWAVGDPHVPEAAVRRWREWTTADCTVLSVEGGHYAHQENPAAVLSACLDGLSRAAGPSRRTVLGSGAAVVSGSVLALGTATAAAPKAAAAQRTAASAAGAGGGAGGRAFDGDPTDPVELAIAMIRQNTSNPGDGAITLPYARMLEGIFRTAEVATEIVPTPKEGNVHFFARVPAHGGSARKKPLLLLGHSDVVPAVGDAWTREPFTGEIADGRLYGRGALDMKGVNAAFVAALLRHVRQGTRFDRDIVFWSDCDEEQGPYGVRWLLTEHPDTVEAGAVLTEGGWVLNQRDGKTPMIAALTCNDKRSLLLRLEAASYATHTSKPFGGQAVIRLGEVLEQLGGWRAGIRPNALSRMYFAELARATADPAMAAAIREMLDARTEARRNRAGDTVVRLSDTPELHNAMLRTTLAFTSAKAGYYPSIVPGTATAEFRAAFLPGGDDPGRIVAELRSLIGNRATLTVVGNPGESEEQAVARLRGYLAVLDSSHDTDVFRAWQEAVRQTHPGVRATACQFEAVTSAVPFRERNVPVYGMYPFTVSRDMLKRMHGTDEHIGVEALRQGTETVYQLLARLRAEA